jgi:hypothetical protein
MYYGLSDKFARDGSARILVLFTNYTLMKNGPISCILVKKLEAKKTMLTIAITTEACKLGKNGTVKTSLVTHYVG